MTSHQLQSLRHPATSTPVFGGSVATGGYSLPGPVKTSTSRNVNAESALAVSGMPPTMMANAIREDARLM
ncbi:MAG TPA: hypothetical protein VGK44_11940 [Casimicrobiaceae bacterium]|jgi:hypothetical protein